MSLIITEGLNERQTDSQTDWGTVWFASFEKKKIQLSWPPQSSTHAEGLLQQWGGDNVTYDEEGFVERCKDMIKVSG